MKSVISLQKKLNARYKKARTRSRAFLAVGNIEERILSDIRKKRAKTIREY